MRTTGLASTSLTILFQVLVAAQLPAVLPGPPVDPNVRFEVVSIKPADPSSDRNVMRNTPGQMDAVAIPVRLLVQYSLRVPDARIVGAPAWVDNDRYTIVAKAPEGTPANANPTLIFNLLKDRFKLATHAEIREMPIYDLVLARADGKLGPALKRSSAECQAEIAARSGGPGRGAVPPGGPGAPPPSPPPPTDFNNPPCGSSGRGGPGIVFGGGIQMAGLAGQLSQATGRPVFDKTRLTGIYDFTLKFAADSSRLGGPPPGAAPISTDADAPNIYTAVQEQLGLKLVNQRGPVEVIVIDRIEKPTLD